MKFFTSNLMHTTRSPGRDLIDCIAGVGVVLGIAFLGMQHEEAIFSFLDNLFFHPTKATIFFIKFIIGFCSSWIFVRMITKKS